MAVNEIHIAANGVIGNQPHLRVNHGGLDAVIGHTGGLTATAPSAVDKDITIDIQTNIVVLGIGVDDRGGFLLVYYIYHLPPGIFLRPKTGFMQQLDRFLRVC